MIINEIILITIPLFALILILCVNELRTGLIPDLFVFPAAIYFISIRSYLGPETWWHYPVSCAGMLSFFLALSFVLTEYIMKTENFGGGCIKLLAVMGAALGFSQIFHFWVVFMVIILTAIVLGYFIDLYAVPSSIYIFLSLTIVTVFKSELLAIVTI